MRSLRRALPLGLALAVLVAPTSAATAASPPPALRARAAVLVEASTGAAIYRRHADRRLAIASTTKLMTALVTLERVPLGRIFRAPAYAAQPAESRIGLRRGERMSVRDLLRALLLPSANDAAVTLADGVSGSRGAFVRAMNRRAADLRLHHTHYANPIGLDQRGNHSSALDLVRLAIVARRDPFFRRTVDEPRARLRTGAVPRVVVNRNMLVRTVPAVNGVKTGHTSRAGYVLVVSETRGGMTLVGAVLGEQSEGARDTDALALLRYGFARFRLVHALRRGHAVLRARVRYRPQERVALLASRSVTRLVRRGSRVRVVVRAPGQLTGPLPRHAVVGTATVRVAGRTVARVALLTARAIPAVGIAQRVGGFFSNGAIWAALLAGAVVLALGARRRRVSRERRDRRIQNGRRRVA